jgi:hypothetical protein
VTAQRVGTVGNSIGGIVLMAIIGFIKNAMAKK